MGKRMKLPFLSHSKSLDPKLLSPSSPWGFPSCGHITTLSFRATNGEDINPSRTFNSVFLEAFASPSRSFSTMSEDDSGDPVEVVIQGLRSDRFFFEPERSSSLVEEREKKGCFSEEEQVIRTEERVEYKESEMVWMDSLNPYEDFKRSMEEMVKVHGLMKDWEGLEELLGCYLKINGKNNHGYILSAFIDLLVSLPFASLPSSSSSTSTSTTTTTSNSLSSSTSIAYSSPSSPFSLPSSSLTTPSLSSILDHHGDDEHDGDDDDDHVSS